MPEPGRELVLPEPVRRGRLIEWPGVPPGSGELYFRVNSARMARAAARDDRVLQEGLRWIEAGYQVQLLDACLEGGKKPHVKRWHLETLRTAAALEGALKRFPRSNLAVVTGPGTGPRGEWVVTVEADANKATPWDESRAEAFAQFADCTRGIGPTPSLESRRGPKLLASIPNEFGEAFYSYLASHVYDPWDRVEIIIGGWKQEKGERVRKATCYIAAPSECGGVERVATDPILEVAQLPDALLDRLARAAAALHAGEVAERLERAARRAKSGFDPDDLDDDEEASWRAYRDARLEEDFEKKVGPAIEGEGGSNATFHAACLIVEAGVEDEDEQLEILGRYNVDYADPEWTEAELLHKLEDARERVGAKRAMEDRLREAWARGYARRSGSTSGRFRGA